MKPAVFIYCQLLTCIVLEIEGIIAWGVREKKCQDSLFELRKDNVNPTQLISLEDRVP